MSGARLVQYGRRAKQRSVPTSSPEPSPKRQRLSDVHDELYKATASSTPTRTYASKRNATAATSHDSNNDEEEILTRPNTPEPPSGPNSTPARTPSRPKDLSQLFAPLGPLSASPTRSPGQSIAKRMLVRSRTEPSLPSTTPPKASLSPASSMPIIPTAIPQLDQPRPSPSSSPALKSAVRTYSQSRSFLVALPVSPTSHGILPNNNHPLALDADDLRESYADLRTRWGVDNAEDDPDETPGVANELMSVSELRSKGESRRFLDEVGYLFEGLEQPGMTSSVMRNSAVEIVLKMCDADFVRKAKAADFIGRAWDSMRSAGAGDGDKVLDPCLACFVALVARNRRDADELARREGFFASLIRLLDTKREKDCLLPQEDTVSRKSGISKAERAALTNLRNAMKLKSNLFSADSIPSTRLLASRTLSSLAPESLPSSLLQPLATSLLMELSLFSQNADSIPDFEHIDNCLRTLDMFLLGAWGRDVGHGPLDREMDSLGAGLITLCAEVAALESESKHVKLARQCLEGAFRVLINLSHTSPEWCNIILHRSAALPMIIPQIFPPPRHQVVKYGGDGDGDGMLDRRCLALGLLTNLVLATEEAKEPIREIEVDLACPRGRRCIGACQCSGRTSVLKCLVRLFTQETETKSETPNDLDFFLSHLAALLCLLAADIPSDRAMVRNIGEPLRRSIDQFLDFYVGGSTNEGVNEMAGKVERAFKELCVE